MNVPAYSGSEQFCLKSVPLIPTMNDFWSWGFSNLFHNMTRGALAEFIVHYALESAGCHDRRQCRLMTRPYDMDGPYSPGLRDRTRIEVKCASYVQSWGKDIDALNRKLQFSISPAVMPDETGDYQEGTPKTRNNDIYVFVMYTAKSRNENILDLSLWQFYVVRTDKIEDDPDLAERMTLSKDLLESKGYMPVSFIDLYHEIDSAAKEIEHPRHPIEFPRPQSSQ